MQSYIKRKSFHIILFFVIILTSCNNISCSEVTLDNIDLEYMIEQELILPARMEINKSYSIVNYIDGDCSVCFEKFILWEKLIDSNEDIARNTRIIFIVSTTNIHKFEYFYEKAGLKILYHFDKENTYCKINNIEDPRLHTMLIDSLKKIKLVGDPLRNKKLLNTYLKIINSNSIN